MRYSWALRFPTTDARVRELSREAKVGLAYACELAENTRDLRDEALHGIPPERLTVQALAREEDVSPFAINAAIGQAQIELFGRKLSDSAIYYRLRRERAVRSRPSRSCAEPGCETAIPAGANGNRRYCDRHAGSAARVARHRLRAGVSRTSGHPAPFG